MSATECRTILRDGQMATVTATLRPRANRAEVKCTVPNAPALAEAMQALVRQARLTEPGFDSRQQVMLSIDRTPVPGDRNWELAAVLADRMVRGAWSAHAASPVAIGWSDNWQQGEVTADAHAGQLLQSARSENSGKGEQLLGGGAETGGTLPHLGALYGHPHPRHGISSARAWFPLHSGGINDALAWVEVSVAPLPSGWDSGEEEDSIAAPGLDLPTQQAVRQVLAASRHFDAHGLGRWKTVVRFGQPRFQGESYQLALVMADRLARGREFVPRGRLVASGCSAAWHAGRVDSVEGREPKCELILRQAGRGDRVLLPKAWQEALPAGFALALRERGASMACIERIGVI